MGDHQGRGGGHGGGGRGGHGGGGRGDHQGPGGGNDGGNAPGSHRQELREDLTDVHQDRAALRDADTAKEKQEARQDLKESEGELKKDWGPGMPKHAGEAHHGGGGGRGGGGNDDDDHKGGPGGGRGGHGGGRGGHGKKDDD